MRLVTILALSSALAVGACAYQPPQTYVPTSSYSSSTEDFRQRNAMKARGDAEWARQAITSGAKPRITIAEGQSSVRESLRDPESARFREVRRNTATGAVCGFVNAKNAYGGYVGEAPFIYYHSPEYQVPQVLSGSSIAASTTLPYIAAFCPADATTVSTDASPAAPKARRRS